MSWWLLLSVARADTCADYADPSGYVVHEAEVAESSGLAASRARPGVYFTHGDANNAPVLYAFTLDGRWLGEHEVRGAALEDWEDLAPGPCPDDGAPCLYVGDIGDNDGERGAIRIYVVREPGEGEAARTVQTLELSYPDGPHDAEALLVHPCTGALHVVTKEDGPATVYRAAPGERVLEPVAEIALDGPVTGGQWDPDGDRLVLRTDDRLWAWAADPEAPDAHWDDPPLELAEVDEDQGEAVAFALDGAIVTTSEGAPLTGHVLTCEAPEPSGHACAVEPTSCGCATPAAPPWWAALLLPLLLRTRTAPEVSR